MDPFVTLTAAAAATKTLKVGTGVCLVAQRDPIQTAKLVASIDQVSGGRFLFGIGNGWNQDELEDHGVKFADRHKVARERVEAMKAIWTKSKPEYHGEFVNFDPMMAWPKPVQKPHPPVIVGGAFPYSARRAIRYGDGWIPQAARGSYNEIGDLIPEFRKMATEAGRNPDEIAITVWFPRRDVDLMKRYADLGVERVVFNLDSEGADKVVPVMDEIAEFMQKAERDQMPRRWRQSVSRSGARPTRRPWRRGFATSSQATARIGLPLPPLIFSGKPMKRKRPLPTS